jgi:pyrimidine-nucleoside phosphorylase
MSDDIPDVNPVEMIARLRQHAVTITNNADSNASNSDGIYTDDELRSFIRMYVQKKIPDYQMSAWLMAVCFCPITPRETATLTRCYAESGRLVEWPPPKSRPPLVDKHSSGGVGDKISLVLAPLVAACGVCVPMMAGRGLGHTGGTIDKLETSFPGYQASPESVEVFSKIVLESGVGGAIVEAGPDLCPADRRIYALRDVTATVSCLPLQTASIMSKKIAENPDSLVLDVKYGDGAFQATVEDAQKLAESMVAVGEANGLVPTTAFLTDMNHPIGRSVGNWVETAECIDVLKGNLRGNPSLRLSQDLITLVVVQAGRMLHQGGSYQGGHEQAEKYKTMSLEQCISHAYEVLDSGSALDTFRGMLLAQGAEPLPLERALESPESIPLAPYVAVWTYDEKATTTGESDETPTISTYVANIPAKTIGDVAVDLGAGRKAAGEAVDGQAGLVFSKQTGDVVSHGEVIVTLYTSLSQAVVETALERVKAAVVLGQKEMDAPSPALPPIVTHMVTREGGTQPFAMPEFLLVPAPDFE